MKVLEGIADAGRADYISQGGSSVEFDAVVSHIFERLLRLEVAFWDMAFGGISDNVALSLMFLESRRFYGGFDGR